MFTVTIKPAIALVWLGALLMAFGGTLAIVRRRWEAVPVRATARSGGAGALGQRVFGWRGTYR